MAQRNSQYEYSLKNLDSSFDLFLKPENEVATASDQLKLEIACFNSTHAEDNCPISFKWIELSAEQGDMEAQFKLAELYSLGLGASRSHTEVYKWYTKAAIQGCKKASIRIHNLYQEDIRMHCRGRLNSKEVHRQREFDWYNEKMEHYYRELNEQRLDGYKLVLNHAIEYYTTQFEKYNSSNQEDPEVQQNIGFLYQHGYGVKKYDKWAIEYYTKAAEQGYTDSQYQLGCLYQQNTEIKFNYRKAFHWYYLAAYGGNIAAQNSLAYFYEKGLGTDIDYQTALSWYNKAAKSGHSGAQLNLGKWYRKGEYVDQNYGTAVKWYSLAARQGNSVAQKCLAQLYQTGKISHLTHVENISEDYICGSKKEDLCSKLRSDIIKLNDLTPIKNVEKLAKRALVGDGNAMYQIGLKYYYGTDFAVNKYIGFKWIRNAAATGLEEAIFRVVKMYEEGDTVEQDYYKAAIWTKRVARTKNSKALCDLGILYNEGRGMRNDPLEASKWLTLSAEQGNSEAQYQLGCLRQEGRALRKNKEEALKLFELSAKQGNANGCYTFGLALFNKNGDGNEKHIEYDTTTFKLLKHSSEKGNIHAQYMLWKFYHDKNIKSEADIYFDMLMLSNNKSVLFKMVKHTTNKEGVPVDYIKHFNLLKKVASISSFSVEEYLWVHFNYKSTYYLEMLTLVSFKGILPMEYHLAIVYEKMQAYLRKNKKEKIYDEIMYWYDVAAKKDDSRAQVRLGMLCEEGKVVEKDFPEAIKYYNLAYKKGNKDAMYRLACLYLDGRGIPQDFEKAFQLFSQASDMGHIESRKVLQLPYNILNENSSEQKHYQQVAVEISDNNRIVMLESMAESGLVAVQYRLGVFYEKKNDSKAVEWFTLAAQNGVTDACYRLAVLYEEGRGVEQDCMKAMVFYEKAIRNEHEDSMYRLAQMYLYGKETKINYKKAYQLYSRAAKMGHVLSCNILDFNLISTKNTSSNENNHTLLMLQHVAEEGNADLQYKLGHFYESVLNEPNNEEAAKWYSMAVDNSYAEAMYHLGLLYETGSGVIQDYKKAIYLYNQSYSLRNCDALHRLGTLYQYGLSVDTDSKRAIQCYTDAANQSHLKSQYVLGKLYEEGLYTKKDTLESLRWYTRAYLKGYDPAEIDLHVLYDEFPYEKYFFVKRNKLLLSVASSLLFEDIHGYNESYGYIFYKLGTIYLFGNGVNQDYAKAMKYFTESATRFNNKSAQNLINLKYNGDRDCFLKLVDMWETLVDDLHPSQQRDLAILYYNGVSESSEGNTFNSKSMANNPSSEASDHIIDKQELILAKNYSKSIFYFGKITKDSWCYDLAQQYLAEIYAKGLGVAKNIQKAIEHYGEASDEINHYAFQIAQLYHLDNDFCDYSEAIKWYERRADYYDEYSNYNAVALNILGLIYRSGTDVYRDYMQALHYFKRSADGDNEYACYNLGLMHYHGQGVKKNYLKAYMWFKIAARKKHVKAEMYLADMYLNGYGVEKNIEKAKKWYSKASDDNSLLSNDGSENGSIWVADIYEFTLHSEAIEWCKRIQENDSKISLCNTDYTDSIDYSVDAEYSDDAKSSDYYDYSDTSDDTENIDNAIRPNLKKALKDTIGIAQLIEGSYLYAIGKMYFNGDKVQKNYTEAYHYFMEAAKKNNSDAQYWVAGMFMNGHGVDKNISRAIEWYTKAANNNNDVAPNVIGELYHFNNEVQDFSKAFKWYQQVQETYTSWALRGIGLLFEYGDGVNQDYKKSVGYYHQSAQLRNKGGYYNLALMYYYGRGVDQEYAMCFYLLKKIIGEGPISEDTYVFVRTENTSSAVKIKKNRLYSLENETTLYGETYHQLGIMYKNGEGVDQSHEEAKKCFLKAISYGNEHSKNEIS